MTKRSDALVLIWIVLTSSVFLFQAPGYHYDEAWIAQYASRIAFEPGFWPIFGMNQYTVPVLSYLQAGLFRVLGHPSLEWTRVLYALLNGSAFFLFFQWVKKYKPQATWVFVLLWTTLPLSVFNHRLALEVTSGFAFFAALSCYGISEGCVNGQKRLWFWIATFALILGSISHVLFFSLILSLIWATAQIQPSYLQSLRVRQMMSWVLLPMIFFFLAPIFQDGMGTGEKFKSAVVIVLSITLLGLMYVKLWSTPLIIKLIQLSRWVVYPVAGVGLFFFFGFEISGVWPISQTTGEVFLIFLFPGFLLLSLVFYALLNQKEIQREVRFLMFLGLALTAFVVINAYKPTSARYWELSMIAFLLLSAFSIGDVAQKKRWMIPLFVLCSGIQAILIFQNYFLQTVRHGASARSYQWLWVKDSALYYRPMIPIYQALLEMDQLCREDQIYVDVGRNDFVLQVYRSFAQQQGLEKECEPSHVARSYWVGQKEWVNLQKNTQLYLEKESWGDVVVARSTESLNH